MKHEKESKTEGGAMKCQECERKVRTLNEAGQCFVCEAEEAKIMNRAAEIEAKATATAGFAPTEPPAAEPKQLTLWMVGLEPKFRSWTGYEAEAWANRTAK